MSSVSKETGSRMDWGDPGIEWREDLDGYVTSFVEVGKDVDLTELLRGLPGDVCPSPHWGYMFKGRSWWRFPDHEESFGPGDAYYVPPGHTSGADAGSEFLLFSPSELMAEIDAHMGRRAQELYGA